MVSGRAPPPKVTLNPLRTRPHCRFMPFAENGPWWGQALRWTPQDIATRWHALSSYFGCTPSFMLREAQASWIADPLLCSREMVMLGSSISRQAKAAWCLIASAQAGNHSPGSGTPQKPLQRNHAHELEQCEQDDCLCPVTGSKGNSAL